MTCIGIGLTVYRWPWVETTAANDPMLRSVILSRFEFIGGAWQAESLPSFSRPRSGTASGYRITTYRRGWTGKPLRHGPSECWRSADTGPEWLVWRQEFIDDELICQFCYDEEGILTHSEHFQGGVLHGPYLDRNVLRTVKGNYVRGQCDGTWEEIQEHAIIDDLVFYVYVTRSFRDGVFHGDWVWKTSPDGVLQSAKYDSGRLVEWNGKPLRQAMEELITPCELRDEKMRELLLSPASDARFQRTTTDFWTDECVIGGQLTGLTITRPQGSYLSGNWHDTFGKLNLAEHQPKAPLAVAIEHALARSQTLIWRDGGLHLVRIEHLREKK
ncbi:hypothetical protein [Anatilimnocola floriformis]|uniref:hypothetical protein n=1 Tax=Anatilimnocola floriformis TaxID=2948575 RepID=UPI0020C2A206|nr:hypothetical protein [Anatilimnocola floriformis]